MQSPLEKITSLLSTAIESIISFKLDKLASRMKVSKVYGSLKPSYASMTTLSFCLNIFCGLVFQVFEYFASIQTPSGEVLMTPADLMQVVIPVFPSSELNRVREGSLKGEWVPGEFHCAPSKNFMLFDTNNDGLVSFAVCVATCSLMVAYNISTTGFVT
ncbi:hypothetical protein CEY00_Acc14515 [Actinidia chinensis var. chinensis]|uniref:Uncharacterized protein n=1 Tax=Actinidia chinensis var. chinensis TaxID=1590841 RepID=A0A2R6QS10_ACTCC|nr:hypothetical protein CEY00_Acc14515 [Actinidia chinensis var. chinensis]